MSAFFEGFDSAFGQFDSAVVASKYAAPYLACRDDGSAVCLQDHVAISRYFQAILGSYHDRGARSCRHSGLVVEEIADRHVLATVTWDLLDETKRPIIEWRESYLLTNDDEWLIRASVDHETPRPSTSADHTSGRSAGDCSSAKPTMRPQAGISRPRPPG